MQITIGQVGNITITIKLVFLHKDLHLMYYYYSKENNLTQNIIL